MESGWVINYKDGYRVILTEERYKDYEKIENISLVSSEEHWFNIEEAKKTNPNLFFFE